MTKANQKVRVAVDAMGGDYAPGEIVKGAVSAAKRGDVDVSLVGAIDTIEAELAKYNVSHLPIHCVRADEFIKEDEPPALAVRRKPNSSIAVATKMVKSGEADAVITAGPTAALVTSAILFLGMVEGIDRPVVGGVLSNVAPNTVIMDLGVNVNCKPEHLLDFAIIGSVYAKMFLNITNPTVALLNIGAEESKGNVLARESYSLLKKSGLNFIGNIEGNGILRGEANVIVCDAFVGNILFKFSESGEEFIGNYFKSRMKGYPFVGRFFKGLFKGLTSSLALPDSVGGGLIWGVDGIALKVHGHSRATDVDKKIGQVKLAVDMDVVGCLKSELATIREQLKL